MQHKSHVSATRDLPTCKMLIRKYSYIFMKSVAGYRNVILRSILWSDSLFTTSLVATLEKLIVCTPILNNGFFRRLVWM